ncbi:stage II sporulation protein R [Pelosinus sp. sgz500959]|uniref:stage II sporulation protein R n=1 Tax=Pelosinus sp. sgz500959 TaxID=3242472 RepID=UPI0036704819
MGRSLRQECALLSMVVCIIIGWFLLIYHSNENLPVSSEKGELIRLHVLANSDSPADQQLKLKVRDAVIAYLAPYLEHITKKSAAEQIVLDHRKDLIEVATQVVTMNGANYPIELQFGVYDFPIKSYGNLVLPAGKYEAVRVLIGNGEGKNWWCVLFPPLCFIDITNATAMPAKNLTDHIENQEVKIEFKSKIAELWRENQD